MVPQYIKQPRGTLHCDADVIQISFQQKCVQDTALSFLRHWGTKFTQKYATFLDGLFAIPTQFYTETFERQELCTFTVVAHVSLAAEYRGRDMISVLYIHVHVSIAAGGATHKFKMQTAIKTYLSGTQY